jgi:glycolate oxidase iron-sulfur subunit
VFAQPSADLQHTPQGRDAQSWLRNCVHCGFCLPTCPTYQVTGSELDGPRGRIYLVKQLVEGGAVDDATREHLDRCLTCRACETACPSGVQYGHLLEIGRELVERQAPRPETQRIARVWLAALLSRRRVFAALLALGRIVRPLLPARLRARVPPRAEGRPVWPAPRHARRVVLLDGCVQPGLAPAINAAAAQVLDRVGISAIRLRGEDCCGALHHHLALENGAVERVRRNVDACSAALDSGAEAIVSTASGCGAMVREYGHLLRHDGEYARRAARVAAAARDLCELVAPADLVALGVRRRTGAVVAWHAPCTLQHAQRLRGRVEALLQTLGCRLVEVADAGVCCGAAGTYTLLQPVLAEELRTRKLRALEAGKPEVVVTANIGCLEHLRASSSVPVRHWIELVYDQCHARDLDEGAR